MNCMLMGIPLVESIYMTIDSNVPRRHHKKKRIQKKWLKRYGTRRIPHPDLFKTPHGFVGHPETIRKLRRLMKEG